MKLNDKQKENIRHIIAESAHHPREWTCALLGIIGGESNFLPQNERCSYTPKRLHEVFSFLTAQECIKLSNCKDPALFFSIVYGPTRRGKGFLGNLSDEDAGKFFGRGLIQITGRGNYEKVGAKCKCDFVSQPNLLNEMPYAARVAVAYIELNMRKKDPQDPHALFETMLRCVGVNTPDVRATKKAWFDFFLVGQGKEIF